MSKRGRPSKSEVFYVLNNRSKSASEVASDLDRTEKFVLDILSKHPLQQVNEDSEPQPVTASDLLARQSGAVMMTEGASQLNQVESNPRRLDCIHNPKG